MKKILLALAVIIGLAVTTQPKANAYPGMCDGTWYGWIYNSPSGARQYYEGCSGPDQGEMTWYRVSYSEYWWEVDVDGMQQL